ncbi:hypothetical protein [Peribacillus glennii]|uniref:Uncharacterized protein n=1 Tax=Peribacillus glennii TaxID=2303991 RepID=A0A372LJM8_9BACI|nr:hypothetical protein [Peribacillus glennii]RFU66680.1 hypothetical protein D0466_00770 [Peribacillus glennii]
MKKKYLAVLLTLLLAISSYPFSASAASSTSIFKSKYPKETILSSVTVDLDKDRKQETVILSKQGNFFLIKGKTVKKVAKGIKTDPGWSPAAKLTVFNPAKGEYMIITRYYYPPGNTQIAVYRMIKGKLVRILNETGDLGVGISKTKINQHWKKYRSGGGWEPVTTVHTWNNAKKKFVASGAKN